MPIAPQTVKDHLIEAGFAFFRTTRLHRPLAPFARGKGAILMMHHVKPFEENAFAPNNLLEIEPGFLDGALGKIRSLGYDLVTMDEAIRRLDTTSAAPFVALTFDDGYRDVVEHALPVLERHRAPFALYVTTGFADRTARLWWVELEAAIRAIDHVRLDLDGLRFDMPSASAAEKTVAFRTLYWSLRGGDEERLRAAVARLAGGAGIDGAALVAETCLDWDGIRALARHPLCTIGAHTLTHPMLAKHAAPFAAREISESRRRIEMETGLPVRHFAYPVGDSGSAGTREFAIAADCGFASAVTTRPGMVFPAHAASRMALPRLSVNGNWQTLDCLEVLLSGVPFAIWNAGRKLRG